MKTKMFLYGHLVHGCFNLRSRWF